MGPTTLSNLNAAPPSRLSSGSNRFSFSFPKVHAMKDSLSGIGPTDDDFSADLAADDNRNDVTHDIALSTHPNSMVNGIPVRFGFGSSVSSFRFRNCSSSSSVSVNSGTTGTVQTFNKDVSVQKVARFQRKDDNQNGTFEEQNSKAAADTTRETINACRSSPSEIGRQSHSARIAVVDTVQRNNVGFGQSKFGSGFGSGSFSAGRPEKLQNSCFACGETGHFSRDCPKQQRRKCFKCGNPGHLAMNCTQQILRMHDRSPAGGNFRKRVGYTPAQLSMEELFEKTAIDTGERFDEFFDAEVRISREGRTYPVTALKSFNEGFLPFEIEENVKRAKYAKLTPVQKYTIPLIFAGIDVMACAPTGSGKTAAFLLPVMSLLEKSIPTAVPLVAPSPLCLIVTPTRELAAQIYQEARKFRNGMKPSSCTPCVLYGGTDFSSQRDSLTRETTILIATTGRLLQILESRAISLKKVRYLVFDEADRMLDMGFSDDIERLMTSPDIEREKLQIAMLSATFPALVQELAGKYLREDYVKVTIDRVGAANRCIKQKFIEVSGDTKKDAVLKLLNIDIHSYRVKQEGRFEKKTLIFVRSKKFADVLASILVQAGLKAMTIHGDRFQRQREEALHFFREGIVPVLIATSVAERGLDIRGVDHVINFDLPSGRDEYVHRIGRTGRVGNPGRATSLYDRTTDSALAGCLVDVLQEVDQKPPNFLLRDAGLRPMARQESLKHQANDAPHTFVSLTNDGNMTDEDW